MLWTNHIGCLSEASYISNVQAEHSWRRLFSQKTFLTHLPAFQSLPNIRMWIDLLEVLNEHLYLLLLGSSVFISTYMLSGYCWILIFPQWFKNISYFAHNFSTRNLIRAQRQFFFCLGLGDLHPTLLLPGRVVSDNSGCPSVSFYNVFSFKTSIYDNSQYSYTPYMEYSFQEARSTCSQDR